MASQKWTQNGEWRWRDPRRLLTLLICSTVPVLNFRRFSNWIYWRKFFSGFQTGGSRRFVVVLWWSRWNVMCKLAHHLEAREYFPHPYDDIGPYSRKVRKYYMAAKQRKLSVPKYSARSRARLGYNMAELHRVGGERRGDRGRYERPDWEIGRQLVTWRRLILNSASGSALQLTPIAPRSQKRFDQHPSARTHISQRLDHKKERYECAGFYSVKLPLD